MQVLTKIHLLKALKKAGLPHSYKSLIKYEKAGIIKRDSTLDIKGNHADRFYTQEEIDEIVAKLKAYKNVQP